jgi:hypothetical protein
MNGDYTMNSINKTVTLATAVLVLLASSFVVCCVAEPSIFAPTWMKEGVYANYALRAGVTYIDDAPTKSIHLFFPNQSSVVCKNATSGFFRWECIKKTGDLATLNVSLTVTSDVPSYNFYASTLVDVDVVSRCVYLQNGTLIGTTHLWLPYSPAEGQEVTLWDLPPDKATANITVMINGEDSYGLTTQGAQRFFSLSGVAGTMNGRAVTLPDFQASGWYQFEFDTGLMVQGSLLYEPMFSSLGFYSPDTLDSVTTNVDMGPAKLLIDWYHVTGLAATAVSIVLVVALIIKRRRKRK